MSAADLVVHSGRLRTLDPAHPRAEAIAITAGRIVAVGTNAEVRAHVGPKTTVLDLRGAAGVPASPTATSTRSGAPSSRAGPTSQEPSRSTMFARRFDKKARAAHQTSGCWVSVSTTTSLVRFPSAGRSSRTRSAIGRRSSRSPTSTPGLASGKALAAAGIESARVCEERADIVCVDDVPTGELREIPALNLVRAAMPALDPGRRYQLCADRLRRLAASGLTAVHVMDGELETLDFVNVLRCHAPAAAVDLLRRIATPAGG